MEIIHELADADSMCDPRPSFVLQLYGSPKVPESTFPHQLTTALNTLVGE